jgi:DNA-binding response OmpR family regulator
MRILVADDDATYRCLLSNLLTQWQFEVEMVADGLKALAAMEGENPPPMAILDWEMPGMDGFEVTRSIRAGQEGDGPYLIIITGSRKKEDIMKVLFCGADDYLIKPFDPVDLKVHLRNAIRMIHLREEIEELRPRVRQGAAGPV